MREDHNRKSPSLWSERQPSKILLKHTHPMLYLLQFCADICDTVEVVPNKRTSFNFLFTRCLRSCLISRMAQNQHNYVVVGISSTGRSVNNSPNQQNDGESFWIPWYSDQSSPQRWSGPLSRKPAWLWTGIILLAVEDTKQCSKPPT